MYLKPFTHVGYVDLCSSACNDALSELVTVKILLFLTQS